MSLIKSKEERKKEWDLTLVLWYVDAFFKQVQLKMEGRSSHTQSPSNKVTKRALWFYFKAVEWLRCEIFVFLLLLFPQNEKKIYLVCIFFEGSVFTFQFLNDKIHNYVKKKHNCEFFEW